MRDPRHELGQRGEALAAQRLVDAGFEILARNLDLAVGEIDLVASDGHVVAFVEVKTRARHAQLLASTLRAGQRRKIELAAAAFVATRRLDHVPCRFDAMLVDLSVEPAAIEWIQGAWELGG